MVSERDSWGRQWPLDEIIGVARQVVQELESLDRLEDRHVHAITTAWCESDFYEWRRPVVIRPGHKAHLTLDRGVFQLNSLPEYWGWVADRDAFDVDRAFRVVFEWLIDQSAKGVKGSTSEDWRPLLDWQWHAYLPDTERYETRYAAVLAAIAEPEPEEPPMTDTPFDFSRFDWYPPGYGGPEQVQSSTGSPRPRLKTPLETFRVHYVGAGTKYADRGDTLAEMVGIEDYSRSQNKPNQYNSFSDTEGQTGEYAGPYRAAHASGVNATDWGHLVVIGLENPRELSTADLGGIVAGIRKARRQAVEAGYLTADHAVEPHKLAPGATTPCPGLLYDDKTIWSQIVAPLYTEPEPAPAPEPVPEPSQEEPPMLAPFPIVAVYVPDPKVGPRWFGLLADGSIRHVSGPDVAAADTAGAQRFPITTLEHYQQLDGWAVNT